MSSVKPSARSRAGHLRCGTTERPGLLRLHHAKQSRSYDGGPAGRNETSRAPQCRIWSDIQANRKAGRPVNDD